MLNTDKMDVMKNKNIESISRDCLVDISTIDIVKELPIEDKILICLEEISNPYCFLCGKTPVRICFTENGSNLSSLLADFFTRLKQ